jgi:hypothetical protein
MQGKIRNNKLIITNTDKDKTLIILTEVEYEQSQVINKH